MSEEIPNLPSLKALGDIQDPEALLAALEDLLAQLQMWVASGSPVALEGLDAHVARLCEAVVQMPAEQSKTLTPRLEALAAQLGEVSERMQQEQGVIKEEVMQLQQLQKAHRAYGKRHVAVEDK